MLTLLGVIILFGGLGWFAATSWLEHFGKGDKPEMVSPSSNQEGEKQNALREKCLQSGIDYSFFQDLIDWLFWQQYPQQQGKNLTQMSQKAQNNWYELAEQILDKLSNLNEQARQNLGRYTQDDNNLFIQQANQLRLSSKALYDLAQGQFSQLFPDQKLPLPADNPLFQIEQGVIFELLTQMQEGNNYEQIFVTSDNSPSEFSNTLQPGQGQAYVVQLQANQAITFTLDADVQILLSIYSPSGKIEMLQDSSQSQWSGILQEDGYYEITLVSTGQAPLKYRLKIDL